MAILTKDRRNKIRYGYLLLGIPVFFLVRYYYLNDPSISQEGTVFAVCPFHHITGLHCPGCGSQRAVHDLLHLRLYEAIQHNAMLILVSIIIIGKGYALWSKKYFTTYYYDLTGQSWFTYLVVVAVLLFWILRNIPVAPFSQLAP